MAGLSDAAALSLVQSQLAAAVAAAPAFSLSPACELPPRSDLRRAAMADSGPDSVWPDGSRGGKACQDGWEWDWITRSRIRMSYATSSSDRSQELVWVWDKVAQTAEAARLLERAQGGRFTHMPVLASLARAALEPESVSSETAAVLHGIVEANEPVVIKPRHGANSHAIALFTSPSDAGAEQLLAACRAAAAVDSARLGEPFQLTRVPPGAIIVPMYAGAPGQEAGNGRWAGAAPLELKVQTLFGVVVGATIALLGAVI